MPVLFHPQGYVSLDTIIPLQGNAAIRMNYPPEGDTTTIIKEIPGEDWHHYEGLHFYFRLHQALNPKSNYPLKFAIQVENSNGEVYTKSFTYLGDLDTTRWHSVTYTAFDSLLYFYIPIDSLVFDFTTITGFWIHYLGRENLPPDSTLRPDVSVDSIYLQGEIYREFSKTSYYYDTYDSFLENIPDSINNPKGRLIRVEDESGWEMLFYNKRGLLKERWQYITNISDTLITKYNYDKSGNLTDLVYPDGSSISYSYDNSGVLTQIKEGLKTLLTRYYNVFGEDSALIYGNSTRRTNTYTPDGLIEGSNYFDCGDTSILSIFYDYRQDERLARILENNEEKVRYNYDGYGRMIMEDYSDGALDHSYIYDKNNNMRVKDDDTLTYYSGTNRLQSAFGKTYTYDDIGRPKTVSPTTIFSYNKFNKRVSKVYYGTSDDNYTYLYTYNWRGYRVRDYEKHIWRELGGRRDAGSIEIYEKEYIHLYSTSGNLLCDYDKNGNLIAKYVYLPGAVVKETSTDTLYLILNRQGSPVVITDKNGIVKKQYRYYAYGAIRSQTGSIPNSYLYTGYIKDNTGLYYAKARYYIEGVGRFLTPDPILSINPYAYCSADPVNYIDPGGMYEHNAADDWDIIDGKLTYRLPEVTITDTPYPEKYLWGNPFEPSPIPDFELPDPYHNDFEIDGPGYGNNIPDKSPGFGSPGPASGGGMPAGNTNVNATNTPVINRPEDRVTTTTGFDYIAAMHAAFDIGGGAIVTGVLEKLFPGLSVITFFQRPTEAKAWGMIGSTSLYIGYFWTGIGIISAPATGFIGPIVTNVFIAAPLYGISWYAGQQLYYIYKAQRRRQSYGP